jgi:FtsP/CotA-like multicopper oxidase with cupredoxin domain
MYSGLQGFFLIRDERERRLQESGVLPSGRFEVPMVLQDRWFNETNGRLEYNRFKEHEMYANYSMVSQQGGREEKRRGTLERQQQQQQQRLPGGERSVASAPCRELVGAARSGSCY